MLEVYKSVSIKLKRRRYIPGPVFATFLIVFCLWTFLNQSNELDIDDDLAHPYRYYFKLVFPTVVPNVVEKKKNFFMIILVNSAAHGAEYRDRRNSIRKLWGNKASCESLNALKDPEIKEYDWNLVFMLGKAGPDSKDDIANQEEAEKYNDILIGDFNDQYANLTIKVFMGYLWVHKTHPSAKYIFKVDDDVYARIPGVIDYLVRNNFPKRFYGGRVRTTSIVHRTAGGKWSVSRTYYGKYYWPTFVTGPLILFSNDLTSELLNHVNIRKPVQTDDTYIAVIMDDLKVSASDISSFIVERDTFERIQNYDNCEFLSFNAFGHDIFPKIMKRVHARVEKLCLRNMTTLNRPCQSAFSLYRIHSYIQSAIKKILYA